MKPATRREFLGRLAVGATLRPALRAAADAGAEPQDAGQALEPIRAKADLPALAGLCLKEGRVVAQSAVGVRKYGDPTPVTLQDQFHLGSCTKAMTAHLCQRLIEQGRLRRETPLAEAFREWRDEMQPAYRDLTLDHLLSHQSGFSGESWLKGRDFQETRRFPGTRAQQREYYTRRILQEAPEAGPETKEIYSNRNFAVAGVLAERAAGVPWEDVLRQLVFEPLGIRSAGYGAMGTPGKLDQPWQHLMVGSRRVAIGLGPNSDNPPAIAPAGTVHMALADCAKFGDDHLRGLRGKRAQLQPEGYPYLHTPLFGGKYMGGWVVTERSWGGGRVFTHSGSNTQNFAVIWLTAIKDFAVLVVTNQGGEAAAKACDQAAWALIQRYGLPARSPGR